MDDLAAVVADAQDGSRLVDRKGIRIVQAVDVAHQSVLALRLGRILALLGCGWGRGRRLDDCASAIVVPDRRPVPGRLTLALLYLGTCGCEDRRTIEHAVPPGQRLVQMCLFAAAGHVAPEPAAFDQVTEALKLQLVCQWRVLFSRDSTRSVSHSTGTFIPPRPPPSVPRPAMCRCAPSRQWPAWARAPRAGPTAARAHQSDRSLRPCCPATARAS